MSCSANWALFNQSVFFSPQSLTRSILPFPEVLIVDLHTSEKLLCKLQYKSWKWGVFSTLIKPLSVFLAGWLSWKKKGKQQLLTQVWCFYKIRNYNLWCGIGVFIFSFIYMEESAYCITKKYFFLHHSDIDHWHSLSRLVIHATTLTRTSLSQMEEEGESTINPDKPSFGLKHCRANQREM